MIRRQPGVTKWVKHVWRVVAVLPGASKVDWHELRREGDAIEYHATTLPLTLHRADAEAYLQSLSADQPSVYIVMQGGATRPDITHVTASAFEAQDFADTGEEIVEKVPMPEGLVAWIRDFAQTHHDEEPFVKRRRDKKRIDLDQDGIGDARVRQLADVYRAPGSKRAVLQ
ncbi:DUF3305 domain-containing protein [Yoonia sp. 2307UL14-13]|uniref:DUF3305 domain-containing protein n=1 Tax=Yoonia sp. 2307UL14-13 TaxID=3126506 RepID=UPI0030EC1C84